MSVRRFHNHLANPVAGQRDLHLGGVAHIFILQGTAVVIGQIQ